MTLRFFFSQELPNLKNVSGPNGRHGRNVACLASPKTATTSGFRNGSETSLFIQLSVAFSAKRRNPSKRSDVLQNHSVHPLTAVRLAPKNVLFKPLKFAISVYETTTEIDEDPFTTPIVETLSEQPRTFNRVKTINSFSSDKSDKNNELTVIEEKRFPFTVVRISSSVSQVRKNNQNSEPEEEQEEEIDTTTQQPATERSPTTISGEDTTILPTPKPKPTKGSKGRPPFLRPLAKFPDIRIPGLDRLNKLKTTTEAPEVSLT